MNRLNNLNIKTIIQIREIAHSILFQHMINNQTNDMHNKLRLYAHNERASSTSSGPKWTSSISDLLVNRTNQMRSNNNQPSQSHQTSQHQLMTHPTTSMQSLPATAADGSRLMMKLMNLNPQSANNNHQPTQSSSKAVAQTFDHQRLSGSRDDQKRLALDECTNYLQQKTMQQQFPSTSMAMTNIINSNRSGSSTGVPLQAIGGGAQSVNSAAAKKFQAFKFNLTLNKNKALNSQKGVEAPSQAQAAQQQSFYQHPDDNNPQSQDFEDDDAIIISDKHRKQMQALSRGPNQFAMKQHLKQMIKSYEDPPQHIGVTENTQHFDHHHETQHIHHDQQLIYERQIMQPQNQPESKKFNEIEDRQRIFEEEIIKRVKEIQNYAKTLHMHLKKLQQSTNKRAEEWLSAKDQILQIRDDRNELSEAHVQEMVEKRLIILDGEVTLQIEHLEQRLIKDYETKISRNGKLNLHEFQSKFESIREEIQQTVQSDLLNSIKQEVQKQVTEKMKEINRTQEKSSVELKATLQENQKAIEDLIAQQNVFQKDITSKQDKVSKGVKDQQLQMNEQIGSISDSLREELEAMRKKIFREVEQKQYATQSDLNENSASLDARIVMLNQLLKQNDHSSNSKDLNSARMDEIEETMRDQLGSIDSVISTFQTKIASQEGQVKCVQEACIQLKSNQASLKASYDEKIDAIESQLHEQQSNEEIKSLKLKDEIKMAIKSDGEKIPLNVLGAIEQELLSLQESQRQTQKQLEVHQQQLSQRLMRSELQEMKEDIDDEIKSLGRVLKKQEDKFAGIDNSMSMILTKINTEPTDSLIKDIQINVAQMKEQLEIKVKQLSDALQSKTEDLYEEVQDLLSKLDQPRQQKEQSPQRSSRSDSITALKVTLETRISEIDGRLQKFEESNDEQLQSLKKSILDISEHRFSDLQAKLREQKADFGDNLDDNIRKINEMDGRVSSLEEKSIINSSEQLKPSHPSEVIESLSTQLASLTLSNTNLLTQVSSISQSVVLQSKMIEDNQASSLEALSAITYDIQSLRELNACLQDVTLTNDEFNEYKSHQSKSLEDRLKYIKIENSKLAIDVEDIREIITQTSEESSKFQVTLEDHEVRIKKLEEGVIEEPMLEVPQIIVHEVPDPNHIHPQVMLRIDKVQNHSNYLTAPRIEENNSPKQLGSRIPIDQDYQGHFLENFSEVISSPNNFGQRNDLLMFNNGSQQSIGRSSMMSNNLLSLVSPDNRNHQFQYSSQITGKMLDMQEERKSHMTPDDVLQGLGRKSQKREIIHCEEEVTSEKESSENGQYDMQEINISLESANLDEPHSAEIIQRIMPGTTLARSPPKQSFEKKPIDTSVKKMLSELDFTGNNEEEFKSEVASEENMNLEEVLGELKDLSHDEHALQQIEQQEEETKWNQTPAHDNQDDAISDDQNDGTMVPQVLLLSPNAQNHSSQQHNHGHHHQHQHQSHHFVAFESSDEEDSQQYDLVPISHSRGGSGPLPVPAPVPGPQLGAQQNSRNRYYESGEEEHDESALRQDADDDFRPQQQANAQMSQAVEEVKDADFDDSMFEAETHSRFSQEEHHHISVQNEEVNSEMQDIQHETLSSHRSSEQSVRGDESRRSGSLNFDHNHHDNINEDDDQPEEGVPAEMSAGSSSESEDIAILAEEVKINDSPSIKQQYQLTVSPEKLVDDADDWSLEDEDIQEEEEKTQDKNQKTSEMMANQIVEDEIIKCIQDALGLKQRFVAGIAQFIRPW